MPERIMPGLGLRAFYDPGQRNWGTSLSEDLRHLSALVQARAASRTTPLPATGVAGQIALVPSTAGANANALALWDQSLAGPPAWVYLTPQDGWQIWIVDEALHVRFTAGSWVEVPRPGVARIRTLTATSHTLETIDLGSILETTGSSAVTVTIPPEASVPFEIGTLVNITQVGAGIARRANTRDAGCQSLLGAQLAPIRPRDPAGRRCGARLCARVGRACRLRRGPRRHALFRAGRQPVGRRHHRTGREVTASWIALAENLPPPPRAPSDNRCGRNSHHNQ